MELTWFAAWKRSLAAFGTRRAVLGTGLAALGIGALGSVVGEGAAASRRARQRARRRRRGAARVAAANCTVCDDLDDCPFTSIQAAIDAADAGDTIVICDGHYNEDITISKDLTLVAADGDEVEIDGTGDGSVVTVPAGVTSTVRGVKITDGTGTLNAGALSGGAVFNQGDLTVADSILQDNTAEFGGAIFNATGAQLTLDNTVVQENDAKSNTRRTFGGAIYNRFGAGVNVINRSAIVENEADNGGAIYSNGELTISGQSQIADNDANFSGGGLFNDQGLIIIDASTVIENKAKVNGGGIQNFNGTLTIRNNSEIGANEAENGGGVFNQAPATLTVIDSAISNNEADDLGGGIFNGGGTVNLQTSTVFRNDAGDTGGGIFNTQGGVVTLDNQSAVVANDPNNCVGTNACGA
jgi:predicted outer membrane repeat protein